MNSDFEMWGIRAIHLAGAYPYFLRTKDGGIAIKEYSELFNRHYEVEDTVRIVNTKQGGLYIKNGIPLVDLFWSRDTLVFVFDKEKSKPAYEAWCRHELS